LRVWTWVTSVFSHSPTSFLHIVGNSIVIYFFGPLVEKYVGSKKFAALFVGSGVVAGLGHMGAHLALVEAGMASGTVGALGASGAAFAILGVLTLLNPSLKVYLYFVLPVPIWLFTGGFALLSVVFFVDSSVAQAAGQGNVAHFAHLAGLAAGLAYGAYVRDRRSVPDRLTLGRGGGGPGGPGGPGGRM
jgi:membrane associated rhomboid family serine protease